MAAKNQHVLPHPDGWAVQGEGSRRATKVFVSKQDAIDAALEIAKSLGSKMLVHGANGQIFFRPEISPEREAKIRKAVREVSGLAEGPVAEVQLDKGKPVTVSATRQRALKEYREQPKTGRKSSPRSRP